MFFLDLDGFMINHCVLVVQNLISANGYTTTTSEELNQPELWKLP